MPRPYDPEERVSLPGEPTEALARAGVIDSSPSSLAAEMCTRVLMQIGYFIDDDPTSVDAAQRALIEDFLLTPLEPDSRPRRAAIRGPG